MGITRMLSIGAVALLAFGCAAEPSGDVAKGRVKDADGTITMKDNVFIPNATRANAGRPLTLNIVNEGAATHNFAIERLDLNTGKVNLGESAHATLEVPEGTIEFVCTYHGGMRGTITGD